MAGNNDFSINIQIGLENEGKQLLKEWQSLKSQIEKDGLKIDFGKNIENVLKPIIQASNELGNLQKQVEILNNKNVQIFNTKDLTSQIQQIDKTAKSISDIKKELNNLGDVKSITINSSEIDKANNSMIKFVATVTKTTGEIQKLQYSAKDFIPTENGLEPITYKFENLIKVVDNTDKVLKQVAEHEVQNNQKIQDAIQKTIEKREQEDKILQQNQDNAINKSLDQEYKDREKIQEQINKTIKLREQENKTLEEKQSKASNKGLDENYNNIQKFVNQSENQLNKLQEKFKGLYSNLEFTKIRDEFNNLLPSDSDLNSKFNNISEKIKQFDGVLSERSRIQNLGNNIGSFNTTGLNLGSSVSEIQTYLKSVETGKVQFNQLSESVDRVNNRVKQIHYTVDQGNGLFQKYTLNVDSASGSVYKLDRGIIDATSHQKSFGDTLKSALESVTGFSLISGAYFTTISAIKDMIVYTGQMDNALTDLNKVVDLSKSQLDGMKQSALELGEALGKDSVSVMASMGEAGRQFKDTEDIKKFTETAVMASNVTDMSAQQAAKSLTTVMKVFKQNINDVQGDLDSFNEIQNNFRKKLCGSKTFSNGLGSLVIRRQGASVMVA